MLFYLLFLKKKAVLLLEKNMKNKIGNMLCNPAWIASGALNFAGEGWRQHKAFKRAFGRRFTFDGTTFVSKTVTAFPQKGNMPLRPDNMPKKFLPDCIYVSPGSFLQGSMLNAVGLSGPGIEKIMEQGKWRSFTEPFMISFMPVRPTPEERLEEVQFFVEKMLVGMQSGMFHAQFAIQLNLSCPNTAHGIEQFQGEVARWLDVLAALEYPVALKLSVTTSPEVALELCKHRACKGLCLSNTVPWGQLPYDEDTGLGIPWKKVFGTDVSPLAQYGGGGYSGKYLLPLVKDWVVRFRDLIRRELFLDAGFHINAGGGILQADDVLTLYMAGADSVSLGCVAILRPWRMKKIIRYAEQNEHHRLHHWREDGEDSSYTVYP